MRLRDRPALRKWLGEFSNIVLGVLVALALGAVATDIGWRLDVADARRAISVELGEILGQARERSRSTACYQRKLAMLAVAIDAADRSGRLPSIGLIGAPQVRTWSHGVWDATLAADTASHLSREELDNLSGVYEMVTVIDRSSQREVALWAGLYAMVGPGRKIGVDELSTLRQMVSEARMIDNQITLFSIRAQQVADAYAIPYDRGTLSEYGDRDLSSDSVCRPVGSVPAGYGAGMFSDAVTGARQHPITRESIGIAPRR